MNQDRIEKIEWWRALPELTGKIMREHYARNLDYVMKHMAENVMWIGAADCEYLTGRENMKKLLALQLDMPCEVLEGQYELIYKSETAAAVAGRLTVQTCEQTGLFLKVKQRVSFLYELRGGRPVIIHIHASNIWEILDPDEKFPYRAGKETYQYVQERIRRGESAMDKLELTGRKHGKYFLIADEIIYVAAKRDYCLIYYLDGRLEVTESIGDLAARLPGQFLYAHRSYIVNLNYVVGMERFKFVLCDNISIPIPEKQYSKIREKVIRWMNGQGKKEM